MRDARQHKQAAEPLTVNPLLPVKVTVEVEQPEQQGVCGVMKVGWKWGNRNSQKLAGRLCSWHDGASAI
jgi:hypothetical protein